ncbi:hypothetical protein P153DRAFT_359515 [Dothidotthia symphoricarpi CBS 119687]|uniref:Uncharacterized protein n=1 Tax=Dothidotthia symphoricarpi CBS 119687 TaxID=1392245 RepID=A0A6A6A4S1_9PLEO|nr:uncharacterized protein P153DRAFT_359515 [Dothidotthia symphoricarpi CBS 119687]KAF2126536.1 hypothetical protein P153DRAFT_359515 [Dothidotthia symphoricarpi CBS 119687]
MSSQMHNSQLPRRTSRCSGTQSTCRSSRIEKPRSHHNSPRMMERRKTTTEPKIYATLDDHYKMMFGITGSEEVIETRPQPSRPVSWHPSSAQFYASQSSPYAESTYQQDWSRQHPVSSRASAHGSDYYSISTRDSIYEPRPSYFTSPVVHGVHRGSDESDSSWQNVLQQTPNYAHSALSTPTTEPLPWYLQQWAQKNQDQINAMSQNGSNDFPHFHQSIKQDEEMEEDDGKELVGLGLYDRPEASPSWDGLMEATGKGLKLEETWQPPEDDDEDEDDDDASSDASIEEPSPPFASMNQQSQQLQMPVHVKAQTPGNMDGRSFFFDEDETASKEWWYQQAKQPSMPVQDVGLGYGWL